MAFADGNLNVNVDVAPAIKATNDVIPKAVYYVTAYCSDGNMKTTFERVFKGMIVLYK